MSNKDDVFDNYHVLETVNQWIFNCDTKVSIIIAAYGIFLTAIFSTDILTAVVNVIRTNLLNKTPCGVIYLLFLFIAVLLFLYGVFKLFCVLIPSINLKYNSVMFFGGVATHNSFDEYEDAVSKKINDNEVRKDLLQQIYVASAICAKKFKNQKTGILYSGVGLALILLWLIISFFVYYV